MKSAPVLVLRHLHTAAGSALLVSAKNSTSSTGTKAHSIQYEVYVNKPLTAKLMFSYKKKSTCNLLIMASYNSSDTINVEVF